MSAGAFLALLAAGAATSVPAPEGSYACTAQGMLVSFRNGDAWKASDKFEVRNAYRYQEAKLTFLPGNRIAVDMPADVLNMSGEFYLLATKEGVTNWTAGAPGYCGVVDAECIPTGAFVANEDGSGNLLFSTQVIVSGAAAKQVGNFEISYKCERAS